jgi:hypothetical protein
MIQKTLATCTDKQDHYISLFYQPAATSIDSKIKQKVDQVHFENSKKILLLKLEIS